MTWVCLGSNRVEIRKNVQLNEDNILMVVKNLHNIQKWIIRDTDGIVIFVNDLFGKEDSQD